MPMKWRFAWALVLALVAAPAFGLGLGQIQVRSQYGEPFLAEIPIVSSDPAELRQLQARLASPETFARIGLQPPEGLVRDLQFNVALDASGRPVIRVTSTGPVDQPLLTFLIEADWGQGRLVREYSALLDAPDAIAAPAQPPIQAPVLDQGDRIARPPVTRAEPVAAGPDQEPAAPEAGAGEEPGSEPLAGPEAESAPAAPAPVAAAGSVPGQYGPVQAGDTLSQIAQQMARESDVSTNQMMLALLRTNPQAFIGGNINLVRAGAVLRMPEQDEARRLSAAEASAEVRTQVARWREMSAPQPQPTDTAVAQADSAEDAEGDEVAQAPQALGPSADARLEIAPPTSSDGQQAGTRSGISAGGEGEMLQQELQETRESLAARDAEVDELKARLAELEDIQSQQQQLITLKDSELAAVQQRLAESNQQPAPTLAQANQAEGGTPASQDAGGGTPWLWIGLGLALLVAAGLAWARTRRNGSASPASPGSRTATTPVTGAGDGPATGSGRSSPTWHAGTGAVAGAGAAAAAEPDSQRSPDEATVPEADFAPAPPAQSEPVFRAPAPAPEPQPEPEPEPEPESAPSPFPAQAPADPGTPEILTGVGERLELAKAYVELGDIETARELLQEVVAAGSTQESGEAARLLQELA
ncbi:MAG: FimV/HubP family polar landmark protein [Luteimonas sp.]